jgi:hypothetical protein
MVGVPDHRHADAAVCSLVDSRLHGFAGHHLPHAVMAVENGGGLCFPHQLDLGHRQDLPRPDAVDIDRLEAPHAVGIDAALVRGDQYLGADCRVFPGKAHAHEDLDHEFFQKVEIHPLNRIGHDCFLSRCRAFRFFSAGIRGPRSSRPALDQQRLWLLF